MNRMYRIVTVLAVLITFVTILASCGGSSSPTEPKPVPTATPTIAVTPTPTPTPKPGTTPTPGPKVLTISPTSTILAPGMAQSFNTDGGNGTYTWTSTGGKLDIYGANATYTAGNTTGTFQVTVQNGTSTATATVAITTTPTPTPTPLNGISIRVVSVNPAAGSNMVVGQQVSIVFQVGGATSGLISIQPSEDGVIPSSGVIPNSVQVGGMVTGSFSVQNVSRTNYLLFYYLANGGAGVQIPGSRYTATYNWTAPSSANTVVIGPGGAFTPRDSGILPVGTVVTYRNDDTKIHQPNSTNSGMVNCPGMIPGGVCTFTVLNLTGYKIKVSVADLYATDPYAEVHSFTVDP